MKECLKCVTASVFDAIGQRVHASTVCRLYQSWQRADVGFDAMALWKMNFVAFRSTIGIRTFTDGGLCSIREEDASE